MATQGGAQPGTSPGAAFGGGGTVEQAKGAVQQLAGQAREQTAHQVESGLTRGKSQAAAALSGVAQALLQSAQPLHAQHQAAVGRYVERAAAQVLRASNYLQNTEVHEIVDGAERAARRQPALFLGGTFALGLLGARFFKNSRREHRHQQSGTQMGRATEPTRSAAYPGGYGTGHGVASGVGRDATGARGVVGGSGPGGSPLGTGGTAGR